MPAFEDEHGTYIMNSRDLRAVEHVPQFVQMGLASLKIEGRTKTYFYAARTAQAYRRAIDDAAADRPFDDDLLVQLDSLANRGYTDGFYSRQPISQLQNYDNGRSQSRHQRFVGDVIERDADCLIIDVKNRFEVGDRLELMTPSGNTLFHLSNLYDRHGRSIDVAPGSQHIVKLPIPPQIGSGLSENDVQHALLMR